GPERASRDELLRKSQSPRASGGRLLCSPVAQHLGSPFYRLVRDCTFLARLGRFRSPWPPRSPRGCGQWDIPPVSATDRRATLCLHRIRHLTCVGETIGSAGGSHTCGNR